MLYQDYGSIVIKGLCNSPKFLTGHFKREINKLVNDGYELSEIEYGLREILQLFKNRINELFNEELKAYQKFKAIDKTVPKENRYNYPKPDIDNISVSRLKYPSGFLHDLSGLTRRFTLADMELVNISLNEVFEKPKIETKAEQDAPKIFEDLFYDKNFVAPCIDILKEVEPPLIDAECNYIGKLKGAFCVWIDEMQRQGIVKGYSDRKIFASLIPQKIKRFSIDESMFGKRQSKAEELYRTDMKTLLSQIKLSQNSQNSQKGKLGK